MREQEAHELLFEAVGAAQEDLQDQLVGRRVTLSREAGHERGLHEHEEGVDYVEASDIVSALYLSVTGEVKSVVTRGVERFALFENLAREVQLDSRTLVSFG